MPPNCWIPNCSAHPTKPCSFLRRCVVVARISLDYIIIPNAAYQKCREMQQPWHALHATNWSYPLHLVRTIKCSSCDCTPLRNLINELQNKKREITTETDPYRTLHQNGMHEEGSRTVFFSTYENKKCSLKLTAQWNPVRFFFIRTFMHYITWHTHSHIHAHLNEKPRLE